MRKKSFIVLVMLFISLILGACLGEEKSSGGSKQNLILATGTSTGVYYQFGSILATLWTNELGQQVTSQGTNGSVENMNLMKNGEATMGFSTVNVMYEAFNGVGSFDGNPYEDLRILANLYPNVNHFIVSTSSGIEKVEEIEGKSFVFGAAGSATEIESTLVLEAHGVDLDSVNRHYVGFTEAVDLLRNNQVDGVNIYAGVPSAATMELISTVDTKVLNFSEDAIEILTDESQYPWNFRHVIPAETYDGQDGDIVTLAQFSGIGIDANVPDDIAYELTKAIWENLEELAQGHAIAEQFDPALAVQGTAGIPLHPGAEKYYKEIGVLE